MDLTVLQNTVNDAQSHVNDAQAQLQSFQSQLEIAQKSLSEAQLANQIEALIPEQISAINTYLASDGSPLSIQG